MACGGRYFDGVLVPAPVEPALGAIGVVLVPGLVLMLPPPADVPMLPPDEAVPDVVVWRRTWRLRCFGAGVVGAGVADSFGLGVAAAGGWPLWSAGGVAVFCAKTGAPPDNERPSATTANGSVRLFIRMSFSISVVVG